MASEIYKPVILVFVSHYLPAYKAGGQLRTIVNMVAHLSDEFEFWIVTGDRDLGDKNPFPSIQRDSWQNVGKAKVYYISQSNNTLRSIVKLIVNTRHDILYLNSFFSFPFSIKPLLAVKYFGAGTEPVILAPRGEFSVGALSIKAVKKYLYMKLSQMLGFYKDVIFQASSEHERSDIRTALNLPENRVRIAKDLPAAISPELEKKKLYMADFSGMLKVTFISRISPMKNLIFALNILHLVRRDVEFDIYGPIEDTSYWLECKKLMHNLPENVKVKYCGEVPHEEVKSTFERYDLFLFPTCGENYGHVIAESLSAGTPVLISDQTPWRNLEVDGLGWELPLGSVNTFAEKLENYSLGTSDNRLKNRLRIKKIAHNILFGSESFVANKTLFRSVLE